MMKAKPRAWLAETDDGDMLFTDLEEARTYCDPDQQPIELFTKALDTTSIVVGEPVAWMRADTKDEDAFWTPDEAMKLNPFFPIPLYAHPQVREAVTVDKIMEVVEKVLSNGNYLDPVWGPNELENMDKVLRTRLTEMLNPLTNDLTK